jgi:hypothetical protein
MTIPKWIVVAAIPTAFVVGGGIAAVGAAHSGGNPSFNPAVTQATIDKTICVKGWTTTVRPPLSYTDPIKRKLISELPSTASHRLADYELDHWVPLEVGGNPTASVNLVLQPIAQARIKDVIENQTHDAVCSHRLTLAQGRKIFTQMTKP